MLRPYPFDFSNRCNITLCGFGSMTRPTEDLHVVGCVGTAECEGDDMVDIPSFAGRDGQCAGGAAAFVGEEEVQTGSG